jgi:hypothetical protein
MNITVKVDDISLATIVDQAYAYGDESGPHDRTVGELVAEMIVDRLVQDRERWFELSKTVTDVKREVIREAVRPMVEQAIAGPIQKTDSYGDPVGKPTTLREVIVAEARSAVNTRDRYDGDRTFLQKTVSEEVRKAFATEIKDAVAQARAAVADEAGLLVATAVTNAMKGR